MIKFKFLPFVFFCFSLRSVGPSYKKQILQYKNKPRVEGKKAPFDATVLDSDVMARDFDLPAGGKKKSISFSKMKFSN